MWPSVTFDLPPRYTVALARRVAPAARQSQMFTSTMYGESEAEGLHATGVAEHGVKAEHRRT